MKLDLMSNDFYRVEFGARSAARPAPRHAADSTPVDRPAAHQPAPPAPAAAPPVASDSVLVPLDQWNRLLGQLGNIHEAGQQLAEARERMGRAETENDFLKERIRDLRAQLERPADTPATPVVAPEPPQLSPRRPTILNLQLTIPEWLLRRRKRNP